MRVEKFDAFAYSSTTTDPPKCNISSSSSSSLWRRRPSFCLRILVSRPSLFMRFYATVIDLKRGRKPDTNKSRYLRKRKQFVVWRIILLFSLFIFVHFLSSSSLVLCKKNSKKKKKKKKKKKTKKKRRTKKRLFFFKKKDDFDEEEDFVSLSLYLFFDAFKS